MVKKSVLDEKFSVNQAIDTLKHPMRSPLKDKKFSLSDVARTGKKLFGGAVCPTCGCGARKPRLTVEHHYDDEAADSASDEEHKVVGEGVKRTRTPRYAKGSAEAKAWGAKMHAARLAKKA